MSNDRKAAIEPKPWPSEAEETLKEREKYQNEIDIVALRKKNPAEFLTAFIISQPVSLRFKDLSMNNPKMKFGIVACNLTSTMINFYAQPVGKIPELSTFDIDEYFKHVYVTLTERMKEEDKKTVRAAYAKYKKNPKEALLCVFKQNGKEKLIPMSELFDDDLVEHLRKNKLDKMGIANKRKEMVERAREKEDEPEEDEPPKKAVKKSEDTSPKKSEKKEEKKPEKPKKKVESESEAEESEPEKPVKAKKVETKKAKEEAPKKAESKKEVETKTPSKKRKKDEDGKTVVVVEEPSEDLSGKLAEAAVKVFAAVFNYPEEYTPIMAKVVYDTAAALRERKESMK